MYDANSERTHNSRSAYSLVTFQTHHAHFLNFRVSSNLHTEAVTSCFLGFAIAVSSLLRVGQEKMGNLGMSFPGNLTCSREIFRSNTTTFENFWAVVEKSALDTRRISSPASRVKLLYFPRNFLSMHCACGWAWWTAWAQHVTLFAFGSRAPWIKRTPSIMIGYRRSSHSTQSVLLPRITIPASAVPELLHAVVPNRAAEPERRSWAFCQSQSSN